MPKFNRETANPVETEVCRANGVNSQNLRWEQQPLPAPAPVWGAAATWAEAIAADVDSFISVS